MQIFGCKNWAMQGIKQCCLATCDQTFLGLSSVAWHVLFSDPGASNPSFQFGQRFNETFGVDGCHWLKKSKKVFFAFEKTVSITFLLLENVNCAILQTDS